MEYPDWYIDWRHDAFHQLEEVLCVKFCKGGRGRAGLGGLAEVGFLVLLKIVHVEVAVGFEPVFVGLDG